MPVTVDTPLCVTDQTRLVTVVGKHIPEGGKEGGEGRWEGWTEGRRREREGEGYAAQLTCHCRLISQRT